MTRDRSDSMYPAGARRADLRASDTERHEASEALSRHFAEGRLDQAEFTTRLDRAMGAVTRRDLDVLFVDLPPAAGERRRPRARRRGVLPVVALVVLCLMVVGTMTADSHVPWVLVLLAGAYLWHRARRRRSDRTAVGALDQ
jgi:hypothetical protein